MVKLSTEKVDASVVKYDSRWAPVYDRIAALKNKPVNEAVVVECDHSTKEADLRKLRLYILRRAKRKEFGFKVETRLRLKKLYIWRTK